MVAGRIRDLLPQRQPPDGRADRYGVRRARPVAALVVEPFSPPLYDDYDIHPDGRTVALVRPVGDAGGREVVVMVNWTPEGSVPVR